MCMCRQCYKTFVIFHMELTLQSKTFLIYFFVVATLWKEENFGKHLMGSHWRHRRHCVLRSYCHIFCACNCTVYQIVFLREFLFISIILWASVLCHLVMSRHFGITESVSSWAHHCNLTYPSFECRQNQQFRWVTNRVFIIKWFNKCVRYSLRQPPHVNICGLS